MMNILVVDDNPGDLRLFKDALHDTGITCNAFFASSLTEARGFVQRKKPDMIFMDVLMPGGSGADFIKSHRSDPVIGRIPVVFLTSIVEKPSGGGTFGRIKVGDVMFPALGKPVKPFEIEESIAKIAKAG